MSEMKDMATETRRLNHICAEMSLPNDLLKEALEKITKAVSNVHDGHERSRTT